MPAKIDLTGQTFGRWRVLRESTEAARPGSWWACVCDTDLGGCGAVRVVRGQYLRGGQSTRCRACKDAAQVGARGTRGGCRNTAEANAKISAAQKGVPKPRSRARACPTCGAGYVGTCGQRYCSPACRTRPRRVVEPPV